MISVRHVVPSSTGMHVILAAPDHDVEIWNVAAVQRIAAFRTIFDVGGRRLALSDQAGILVAAAYICYGIAGYAMTTGEVLWRRRDIKASQVLSLSPDGSVVYCGLQREPLYVKLAARGSRGEISILPSFWIPPLHRARYSRATWAVACAALRRLTCRICVPASSGATHLPRQNAMRCAWPTAPPTTVSLAANGRMATQTRQTSCSHGTLTAAKSYGRCFCPGTIPATSARRAVYSSAVTAA